MANQLARDPGELRDASFSAEISRGVPDIAADAGGALFATLGGVAGNMQDRLFRLAQQAGLKEIEGAAAKAGTTLDRFLQAQERIARPGTADGKPNQAYAQAPGDIRKTVSEAAARHGVDPAAMLEIARIESSFNPNAKNPRSSAGGLFQFVDGTARDYGLKNRFDPVQAADAAARLAKDNQRFLTAKLGRAPSPGELYLAHQQGAGGAMKLLANPDALAVNVVGADAVTLNGGDAGMTAGQFAAMWTNKVKAGNAATGAATPGGFDIVPRAPGMPTLALRRDGTILGDAYDKAVLNAASWRIEAGIAADLGDALDKHGDDPAAYAAAVDAVEKRYRSDPALKDVLNDPAMNEAFTRAFSERTRAGTRDVLNRAMTRQEDDAQSAFAESAEARLREIERQGRAGAVTDADMGAQVQRFEAQIDGALEQGLITPQQAAKQRKDLTDRATFARVQGAFNQLPTPEQKVEFAAGLMAEFDSGEGPFALFERDTVRGWASTLADQAQRERTALDIAGDERKMQVKARIRDDLASIGATGMGLDGMTAEEVRGALGEDAAAQWALDRQLGQRQWRATEGMERMTPDAIQARVAALVPKPGADGYAEAEALHEAAVKRANAVLQERAKALATDPLTYGEARGDIQATPRLDELDANSMAETVQQRMAGAATVAELHGVPMRFFKPGEADALMRRARENPDEGARIAAALVTGAGPQATRMMAELGDGAPMMAHAGSLLAAGGSAQASSDVIRGVSKDVEGAAKRHDILTVWNAVANEALAAQPEDRNRMVSAALAIARVRLTDAGIEPDAPEAQPVLERAVQEASGATYQGGVQRGGFARISRGGVLGIGASRATVLVPPGMAADMFGDVLEALTDADLPNPPQGGVDAMADLLPVAVAGGYAFTDGEAFLPGFDGRVFVLDVNGLKPKLAARVPGAWLP